MSFTPFVLYVKQMFSKPSRFADAVFKRFIVKAMTKNTLINLIVAFLGDPDLFLSQFFQAFDAINYR